MLFEISYGNQYQWFHPGERFPELKAYWGAEEQFDKPSVMNISLETMEDVVHLSLDLRRPIIVDAAHWASPAHLIILDEM